MNRKEIRAERRRLKAKYRQIFDDVAELLFRHDPMHINYQSNSDEYEPEVSTVLPRLHSCSSADEARRVVHEEFCRWFGPEVAGRPEAYTHIANEIWEKWQKYNPEAQ